MKELANILLAENDSGGLVELLILVVLVIIGAIGSVIQKARKDKEGQETADRWRREREQKERRGEGADAEETEQVPAALGRMEQQARQNLGLTTAPPTPRTPPEILPMPAAPQPVQADGELLRKQRRRAKLLKQRQAELARKAGAVPGRTVKNADAPAGEPTPAAGIDLSELSEVQKAIVHLEIFSPPKALRRGAELWDR